MNTHPIATEAVADLGTPAARLYVSQFVAVDCVTSALRYLRGQFNPNDYSLANVEARIILIRAVGQILSEVK